MNNHRNFDYLIRLGKKYKETIFVDHVSGKNLMPSICEQLLLMSSNNKGDVITELAKYQVVLQKL